MTSIVELFPKCRKLAYDARQQLAMLQQQQQQQTGSSHHHTISRTDVMMIINELNNQLQYMESSLLQKEIPQQRMIWQRKIYELQQESQLLLQQCNTIPNFSGATSNSNTYQSNRDELLNLRQRRTQQQRQSNEGDLHNLSLESKSIQQSQNMISEIIQSGEQSYHELKLQRKRMNTVSSMLYTISDTIGLSKMTMQIIERRDVTDLYYVIGGMIITLIVLYITWFM
jgi:golgi SNAP receptor complex member 2